VYVFGRDLSLSFHEERMQSVVLPARSFSTGVVTHHKPAAALE
jgi:hypothetical protein